MSTLSIYIYNFFLFLFCIKLKISYISSFKQVEIEVPRTCSYIVRTTECTLSEAIDVDAEGNPIFGPSAGADAFKAAMEKYVYQGSLYQTDKRILIMLNKH